LFFNLRFYYKILKITHLINSTKLKKQFFFLNLIKTNKFFIKKNSYISIEESKKYLNKKKSWINLKKYYYFTYLSNFIPKLYVYQNYSAILKNGNQKINSIIKTKKIIIFKNFFDYWFNLIYLYLFFIETLNKKNFKFFYFLKNKKNWNIISFKLNVRFLFRKNLEKNTFNEIFTQEYYFLDLNKVSTKINLQLLTKNLKISLKKNFSIFYNKFFPNQLKKIKLIFLQNIVQKWNEVQKIYLEKKITKINQYLNYTYPYKKIITLMIGSEADYKTSEKPRFFSFIFKYSLKKFLNLNLESFYLNYLTNNQLCGFFINILFHGIEYDFYYWIYLKKKLKFKKSGFFLRYGTQIILFHTNYSTLKDSEEFFKIWSFSNNIKLKINQKEYRYSLNTKKTFFFRKKFQLKKYHLSKKFSSQGSCKLFFNNSLITHKFFYTNFILNCKKIIFLENYDSFLFQKFFNNFENFLFLQTNQLDISNFNLNRKISHKTNFLGPLVNISLQKKIKLTKVIKIFSSKLMQRKTKQGLIFLGFYIYQFQNLNKFFFTKFRKVVLKICIIPSKLSIKDHLNQLKKIIKKNLTKPQKVLIINLSPIIRSWAQYYNIVSTKKIHRYCDYILFKMLWKWACKRHSKKSKKWVKSKYFHCLNGKNWIFGVYNKLDYSFYCLPNHSDIRFCKLSYLNEVSSVFYFEIIF
jgi:hypothetical protein